MNVNIIGPVNNLGYGLACVNLMVGLDKLGHKVSYFPVAGVERTECPAGTQSKISEMYKRGQLFDPDAPCVRIWHQFDMGMRVGRGKFYGFPFFELDTFNELEKHHLAQTDTILVTCKWAEDVVKANIPYAITGIVPLGVDTTVFKPVQQPSLQKTIFFNAGKWEVRKGHDILCQAFNKAFMPSDNVELWLLCNNPFLKDEQTQEWTKMFMQSPMGSKIKILPRQQTSWDVARLMQRADCGVFPSHGEGWNLELLEMMACGKQVIATNYSAHTEFCNSQNSLLVDTFGVEPAKDGIWFHGQGNWAKLTNESIDQIVQYMRQVHQQKLDGLDITNVNGTATAEQFTWDNAARKLIGCFNGNSEVVS